MTSGVQALLADAKQPWQKGFEQRLNTLPAEFVTIIRDKSNGLSTSDQAFADGSSWVSGSWVKSGKLGDHELASLAGRRQVF